MLRREFLLVGTMLLGGAGCTVDIVGSLGPSLKQFDKITPGMTEKQVVAIMGNPSKRMSVQGGEGGLDRLIIYRWLTSNHIFTVTFDSSGAAVGKTKV